MKIKLCLLISIIAITSCAPTDWNADLQFEETAIFFDTRAAFVNVIISNIVDLNSKEKIDLLTIITLQAEKALKDLGLHPQMPETLGDAADRIALHKINRPYVIRVWMHYARKTGELMFYIKSEKPGELKINTYFFSNEIASVLDCSGLDRKASREKIERVLYPILRDSFQKALTEAGYLPL